ncbi:MAG: hypothetical protein GWN84_24660 [Gammaproteobacteria bacterium]|nr:hypothetical protein [Gammaproteobacteria bacterium]NIR82621.1 hypothetical protein [Gammaproteobacteria bacterium]NIR89084.1 hypothetical protein [Gammaproteobacteria bacterium]NIU03855.1 hypothetical protein [Gammaproteobacteria bacterium]NIV74231.1 hypothetical protein [Gammaproteobacteria bacterium]
MSDTTFRGKVMPDTTFGDGESYKGWSSCSDCGYQGLFVFWCRKDEDYADPEALGFVLDVVCPACESREAVLVTAEQFREMARLS